MAVKLFTAFLESFEVLDKDVKPQDWTEAQRWAERIRRTGGNRKLGDCLIQAIAKRLNAEVVTKDQHFQSRIPPRAL